MNTVNTIRCSVRAGALCVAAALYSSSAYAADTSMVEHIISSDIKPSIQAFHDDAVTLEKVLNDSCYNESGRWAFNTLVQSFSHVEILQLGELLQEHRLERIFYWPDRKSIGQKQLYRLLAEPELSSLTLARLEEKSVALQGMPALERILFQIPEQNEQNCHVAKLIAANLVAISEDLVHDWGAKEGIASLLENPSSSSRYRNEKESIAAVLKLTDAGISSFREKKISIIIKGLEKSTFTKSAPFYRSGQTFNYLRGNLAMISMIALDDKLSAGIDSTSRIAFEFQRAEKMLDDAEAAIEKQDYSLAFQRMIALRFFVDIIHQLLLDDIFLKHQIGVGFNSGDGD